MELIASPPKRSFFPPWKSWSHALRFAAVGGFLFGLFLLLGCRVMTSRWVDFPVYFDAGAKAWAGLTVYDVQGHFQYKYSPSLALFLGAGFSPLTPPAAAVAFSGLMRALWLALFAFWNTEAFRLRGIRPGVREILFAMGLSFLYLGAGIRMEVELGQINALPFALLTAFYLLYRREASAGFVGALVGCVLPAACLALAVQVKLHALLFLLWPLSRRDFSTFFMAILLTPFFAFFPVAAVSGWDFAVSENLAWITSLTSSSGDLLFSPWNISLWGVAGKITGLPMMAFALWASTGCLFAYAFVRRRPEPGLAFMLLSGALVIWTPLSWSYWILWLLPAIAVLFTGLLAQSPLRLKREARWMIPLYGGALLSFHGQESHKNFHGPLLCAVLFVLVRAVRENDLGIKIGPPSKN